MPGRKTLTFSSASSPSPAASTLKPQLLISCSMPDARGGIVLDDEHAFVELVAYLFA